MSQALCQGSTITTTASYANRSNNEGDKQYHSLNFRYVPARCVGYSSEERRQ